MAEQLSLALVFGAGLLSVLSPCVLPVIPIVVTGNANDHKTRPLLIVAGIALSFMSMGVVSSLFGEFIGPLMYKIEKVAAALVIFLGLLLTLDINFFKGVGFFSRFAGKAGGRANGFVLGATLGLIWIPCVGPILGGVLAMVAGEGKVVSGLFYLFVYSLGFSVPMLLAGYASHYFRSKLSIMYQNQQLIRIIGGIVLVLLGIFIFVKGMMGFNAITFTASIDTTSKNIILDWISSCYMS